MPVPAVPVWFAGSVTVAAFVLLGIFVYPWLLARPRGRLIVALLTLLLAGLFLAFDPPGDPAAASLLPALLWAIAPVIVGAIVFRLQQPAPPDDSR
jgi:hypothetical protein